VSRSDADEPSIFLPGGLPVFLCEATLGKGRVSFLTD